jgi:hypothetical protein
MPGIQVVGDGGVFSPPVLIPVFIFIFPIVFVTMVNGNSGDDFYLNTKIRLWPAAMDSSALGGQRQAQEGGEQCAADPKRLHAGENVHACNLPSTLITGDGTALCLKLKNWVRRRNDVAQTE